TAIDYLQEARKTAVGAERILILWKLANIFIQEKQFSKAQDILVEMHDAGFPTNRINAMRGDIAVRQQKWREAADLFEKARPGLSADLRKASTSERKELSEIAVRTDLLLSTCYEQLNDTESQKRVLLRARELAPENRDVRLGLISVSTRTGNFDEAIEQ